MTYIAPINDFEEFRKEIQRLYGLLVSEQERQMDEYHRLGITVPSRISIESLDLHDNMAALLRIHKTLQWRGHNYRLKASEARQARLLAIAGICEMIKEEYVGRFWRLYERKIGWGQDSTVYDWIWERGFKEAGIDLIRGERREFVQTLIMESGIPKAGALILSVFLKFTGGT